MQAIVRVDDLSRRNKLRMAGFKWRLDAGYNHGCVGVWPSMMQPVVSGHRDKNLVRGSPNSTVHTPAWPLPCYYYVQCHTACVTQLSCSSAVKRAKTYSQHRQRRTTWWTAAKSTTGDWGLQDPQLRGCELPIILVKQWFDRNVYVNLRRPSDTDGRQATISIQFTTLHTVPV